MWSIGFTRARRFGLVLAIVGALAIVGTAYARPAPAPTSGAKQAVDGVAPPVSPDPVIEAALPPSVPGARWLVVNAWEAQAFSITGGGAVVTIIPTTGHDYVFSYPTGSLIIPLDLPSGAVVYRIDAYGYRTSSGDLDWEVVDRDTTTEFHSNAVSGQTTSGLNLHHASFSMPSGLQVPAGHSFALQVGSTYNEAGFMGAIVQYKMPATTTLIPITPVRVYDSRCSGAGGPLSKGHSRTINVKNALTNCAVSQTDAIPQGAMAVAYNLTITGTSSRGFVDLLPGASTTVTSSSINWWTSGITIANGGVVALGTDTHERQVTFVVDGSSGASTQIILDVTGFYFSES